MISKAIFLIGWLSLFGIGSDAETLTGQLFITIGCLSVFSICMVLVVLIESEHRL